MDARQREERDPGHGAVTAVAPASKVPLRVGLFDVGARRRAELARRTVLTSAPVASPVPAVAPKAPAPYEALCAQRTALTERLARLHAAMLGTTGTVRAQLATDVIAAQADLTRVNNERRALYPESVGLETPRKIVAILLSILDRAQDAGFVRDDAEHVQMDGAARWLEEHGGGDR